MTVKIEVLPYFAYNKYNKILPYYLLSVNGVKSLLNELVLCQAMTLC